MANALRTGDYIVAFIDVLGAKRMIKEDVDGNLNVIHEVYEKSLELYKKVLAQRMQLDITIFSDNIVVAKRIYDKKKIASFFRAVQTMAAVGDALVKAYSLEGSVAIYPRIGIDPELVGKLHIFPDGPEKSPYWLRQDQDGIVYVDYLQRKHIKNYDIVLLQENARYDDRIAEAGNDIKVIQKTIWHANYIRNKLTEGDSLEENETIQY